MLGSLGCLDSLVVRYSAGVFFEHRVWFLVRVRYAFGIKLRLSRLFWDMRYASGIKLRLSRFGFVGVCDRLLVDRLVAIFLKYQQM
ncbi:MAG: hypothetical protein HC903_07030 [Methylacidiphilales bacterium]|nr:hypothetical protein [Candidatus Methylacidiphilales bacterium]NJR17570.1 hypothetical protein [Calothrix sp. CSU_2_0]